MMACYPGSVLHVTCLDNFMQEQETVIAQIVQFATDPQVRAIVVCQASHPFGHHPWLSGRLDFKQSQRAGNDQQHG